MLDEFGLIAELLAPLSRAAPGAFGLTDDAALLSVAAGHRLVISKDMIVAGVHCLADDDPGLIARKLLRVNLSDLAAMGAAPRAYLLGLSLPPDTGEDWLRAFVAGLALDQESFGVDLIGGDTVSGPGPFTASVTALGDIPDGGEIRRKGAQPGDILYVSGSLGDSALGLMSLKGRLEGLEERAHEYLRDRYHLPRPRLALGPALRGIAHAMIDISDGLVADLGHICRASGVAGEVDAAQIPLSTAAAAALALDGARLDEVLGGGDDYELLFTADAGIALISDPDVAITPIGRIAAGEGVTVRDESGAVIAPPSPGWRHF